MYMYVALARGIIINCACGRPGGGGGGGMLCATSSS